MQWSQDHLPQYHWLCLAAYRDSDLSWVLLIVGWVRWCKRPP